MYSSPRISWKRSRFSVASSRPRSSSSSAPAASPFASLAWPHEIAASAMLDGSPVCSPSLSALAR